MKIKILDINKILILFIFTRNLCARYRVPFFILVFPLIFPLNSFAMMCKAPTSFGLSKPYQQPLAHRAYCKNKFDSTACKPEGFEEHHQKSLCKSQLDCLKRKQVALSLLPQLAQTIKKNEHGIDLDQYWNVLRKAGCFSNMQCIRNIVFHPRFLDNGTFLEKIDADLEQQIQREREAEDEYKKSFEKFRALLIRMNEERKKK